MSRLELEKFFDHKTAEARWYAYWEKRGYFKAGEKDGKQGYCIVIPPPNVTGILHLGHALNNTLQDILIRYHRMQGKNVLWQPGTDHAGIATQFMVEKQLQGEGTGRRELGRDKFIERVWKWKDEKGGTIISQLKRLGASCDWSRERFTMDEGLSRAVREVFVRLYEEGLIYRGEYLVNWCPGCDTALSNLEVELSETDEQGSLWHIRYPLVEGKGHVTVATTRPETMLGDTAVAVHPDDDRYKHLVGKMVRLPCTEREIPIIADSFVDKEFGTGALKITPAHDFNDFEIGRQHGLEAPSVIDTGGRMQGDAGKYLGMDRFEARREIVADLEDMGLLEKIEPYPVRPGRCYRCHTIVEPTLSTQWFVRTKPLAEPAIEAVKTGKTIIIPESEKKKYFNWMENIKDWCISRQLWWGHQIPAWYCRDCGEVTVSMVDAVKCSACNSENIERDPDVLDTWFSSALWPFSTLGWPEENPVLERYYPNSAMVTAFDILYFWVARMMMMGIKFMGDVPFKDVYIHGLVRDEKGLKFSKTKGNIIDPLVIIQEHGADALRFTLALYTLTGRDIRLSLKRIEDTKKFINKIWNAAKFSLSNLDDFDPEDRSPVQYSAADLWIQSRLQAAVSQTREHIDGYRFSEAAQAIYHFVWDEVCDWYIEWSKPVLYRPPAPEAKRGTQRTLLKVLDYSLRLLHPFMPFVTEEIWQTLPGTGESIMMADFPIPEEKNINKDVEERMSVIKEVVTSVRNLRAENLVPLSAKVKVTLVADNKDYEDILRKNELYISSPPQVGLKELLIKTGGDAGEGTVKSKVSGAEVCLHIAGLVDYSEEGKRIERELKKIKAELEKVDHKLNSDSFIAKAPEEVVEKQRRIRTELVEKSSVLEESRDRIGKLKGAG